MSLISWNCRGLGKASTRRRIHHLVQSYHPSLMYFCETLTKVEVACTYFSSWGFSNFMGTDAAGKSGGTILVWGNNLNVKILDISPHWIHVFWTIDSGKNILLTV